MPNPKREHLPIPTNLTPENRVCFQLSIPFDSEHLAAFWGALDALAQRYTWGKPLSAESAVVADYWQALILENRECYEEALFMANSGCGCCPEAIFRYDPVTGLRERSDDNGETWTPDESDPRISGSILPPPPWLLLPGDHNCEGATTAAINMEFAIDQIFDVGVDVGVSGVTAAVVAILCAVAPPACPAIGLVGSIALALIQIGAEILQTAMTAEVYEDFKCVLFCHIEADATFTEAGWQAVKADIVETFDADAEFLLWNIVNIVGPVGLSDMARQSITVSANCDDCACDPCENLIASVGTITDHPDEFTWSLDSSDDGFGQQVVIVQFGSGGIDQCCCILSTEIVGFAPFQFYRLCGDPDQVAGDPGAAEIWEYRVGTGVGGASFGLTIVLSDCV